MVSYRLEFAKRVKSDLKNISPKYRPRLEAAFKEISQVPLEGKPLTRELIHHFTWHVSVYRILYKVNSNDKVATVLKIDHRGKVYN